MIFVWDPTNLSDQSFLSDLRSDQNDLMSIPTNLNDQSNLSDLSDLSDQMI